MCSGRKVAIDASMSIYQFLIAVRQDGSTLTNADGETTRFALISSELLLLMLHFEIFFYPDYHTLNHFTTNILALWACALTGSPSNMSVAIC